MAKKLHLGVFLTISRSNISKLRIFLKNRFNSNWRSYLVLTSGQKLKKSLEPFFEKNIKVSDFGLIWRPFGQYLQIKSFFKNSALWLFYLYSPLTSCKKSEKFLLPFLRKLRYQPTNQLLLILGYFVDLLENNSKSRIFFKNLALRLFYLYSHLTSWKKSEKSLQLFLRKLHYQPANQATNYYWFWTNLATFLWISSNRNFFSKIWLCDFSTFIVP